MLLHLHVCAKDILEKKWDKLCEIKKKKKSERLLLEVTSSPRNNKGHTDNTQVSLRTSQRDAYSIKQTKDNRVNKKTVQWLL